LSDERLTALAAQPGAAGNLFRAEQERRKKATATAAAPAPTGAGAPPSATQAASEAQTAAMAASVRQRRRAGSIQPLRAVGMGTIAGGNTGRLAARSLIGY
jgi:hypothetical protein